MINKLSPDTQAKRNIDQALSSFKPLFNQFGQELSFGAEVLGIDLSKTLSSYKWKMIWRGFKEHYIKK